MGIYPNGIYERVLLMKYMDTDCIEDQLRLQTYKTYTSFFGHVLIKSQSEGSLHGQGLSLRSDEHLVSVKNDETTKNIKTIMRLYMNKPRLAAILILCLRQLLCGVYGRLVIVYLTPGTAIVNTMHDLRLILVTEGQTTVCHTA